jgi:hypothetical protein
MMTSSTKSSFYDPAVAKQPAVEATIGIIHDETDAIDERDDGSGGTATAVEEPRIKDIRENRSQVLVSSVKEEQVSIKTLQDNLAAALAAMAEMTDNEEDLKQKLEQVLSRTNYLLDHAAHTKPLFPNYYNRAGVGTKWHYPGHTTDLLRVICAYYALLIRHPCIAMRGMSWSLKELFDRLAILSPSKKAILKQLAFPLSFVVPIVGIPIFFALATLPCVPKPQQFNKFSGCGLMNYCVSQSSCFLLLLSPPQYILTILFIFLGDASLCSNYAHEYPSLLQHTTRTSIDVCIQNVLEGILQHALATWSRATWILEAY